MFIATESATNKSRNAFILRTHCIAATDNQINRLKFGVSVYLWDILANKRSKVKQKLISRLLSSNVWSYSVLELSVHVHSWACGACVLILLVLWTSVIFWLNQLAGHILFCVNELCTLFFIAHAKKSKTFANVSLVIENKKEIAFSWKYTKPFTTDVQKNVSSTDSLICQTKSVVGTKEFGCLVEMLC